MKLERWAKRCLGYLRDGWIIIGLVVVGIFLVESISYGALTFISGNGSTPDPRVEADAYQGKDWVDDYFREFHRSSRVDWRSYYYWKRKPFNGKYINVNLSGIRHTEHPDRASLSDDAYTVFVFGGSTTWGTGARDQHTIPSYLARLLPTKRGHPVRVVNFGETGFVSTQELIQLIRLLQLGRRPDHVIFYDGINDSFAAFQSGRAGIPMNESHRRAEFNLLRRPKEMAGHFLQSIVKVTSTYKLCQELGLIKKKPIVRKPPNYSYDKGRRDRLASDVVETYRENIRLVEKLGHRHDFKADFFWQPVVFTRTPLTKTERDAVKQWQPAKAFYEEVYARVEKLREMSSFHDLSDVLNNREKSFFLDAWHISEAGNEIVATEMARRLNFDR